MNKENFDKNALRESIANGRKNKVEQLKSTYKAEIEQLPKIFKVRMAALKEIKPKEFANSPELILSSLVATYLIRTMKNHEEILKEEYISAHAKYGLDLDGDVNPNLVCELVFSYFADIKNGAINENDEIIDITKSKVMAIYHNLPEYGIPKNAIHTVAQFAGAGQNIR